MLRKFDTVIYHANCPDGFTSAWAFWSLFRDRAEYLPYRYGQEPPDLTGKRVAIVDFSFPRETLLRMVDQAQYLVVLDHHKSAERDLDGLNLGAKGEIIFDMARSGAQIAWDYLFASRQRPWFVDYVADRDLWRNELPQTKEISQTLFFDGYFDSFSKLDELSNSLEPLKEMSAMAERGLVLLEYKTKECEMYAKAAKPTIFRGYRVNLAGCPRAYRSEVGNLISMQDCDFAAVYWYDYYSKEWLISFRASKECPYDLSEITSQLPNGGGHPKAAGFTIYEQNGENLHTYFAAYIDLTVSE
uniref:DHH family phosphohydrolase n=1 Tax=Marseillevirus LCMAC202 TaxID=2506606 RepID=A0A481YYP9_9VIRU|nr:MAG: DHH family phosphohydrolase [Marseillevirus LCMAC202]